MADVNYNYRKGTILRGKSSVNNTYTLFVNIFYLWQRFFTPGFRAISSGDRNRHWLLRRLGFFYKGGGENRSGFKREAFRKKAHREQTDYPFSFLALSRLWSVWRVKPSSEAAIPWLPLASFMASSINNSSTSRTLGKRPWDPSSQSFRR